MTAEPSEILRLVARQLGRREIEAGQHLREDLGVESIDFLNVISALEDRWGLSLLDEEIEGVERVEDLVELITSKS